MPHLAGSLLHSRHNSHHFGAERLRLRTTRLADDHRAVRRDMPAQERFVEAFYSIAVTDNVVVRPNIQYITRRATPEHKPDVVVFGLTSLITF